MWRRTALVGLALAVALTTGTRPRAALPRPDHIVIVVEENKLYSRIIGNPEAPYINSLAARGVIFTNFFALTHPSQPNYLALFSGSFQGVTSNTSPPPGAPFDTPNLGTGLFGAGLTFAGYSEGLPYAGFLGATHENYRRRHNPWSNFSNIPATSNLPFTDFPPPDQFDSLPTVAFVIPDLVHDMHSGTIATGDEWLRLNLDAYIQWAADHNSLFILTFDESDSASSNHILTLMVGPMVKPGYYPEPVHHLHLLRTLEDLYGLSYAGDSAIVEPIVDVWVTSPDPPPPPPPPAPAPSDHHSQKCGGLGMEAFLLASAIRALFRRG
jgi:phosphatidylinositol-3-phosphatase